MWHSERNTFKFSEDFSYLKFDMYFYKTKMLYPTVGILVWHIGAAMRPVSSWAGAGGQLAPSLLQFSVSVYSARSCKS